MMPMQAFFKILIHPREINVGKLKGHFETRKMGVSRIRLAVTEILTLTTDTFKFLTTVTLFKICCKLRSHIQNFSHMGDSVKCVQSKVDW